MYCLWSILTYSSTVCIAYRYVFILMYRINDDFYMDDVDGYLVLADDGVGQWSYRGPLLNYLMVIVSKFSYMWLLNYFMLTYNNSSFV